jgi:hypothetical protein
VILMMRPTLRSGWVRIILHFREVGTLPVRRSIQSVYRTFSGARRHQWLDGPVGCVPYRCARQVFDAAALVSGNELAQRM